MRQFLMMLVLLVFSATGHAAIDTFEFSTVDRQQRFSALTDELRCPKCQNQNIADSNSPIANDLRREIYRMVEEGMTDDQIVDFLVDRYGEFVLYKPRLSSKTLVLWGGPLLFLLLGLGALFSMLRKNAKTEIAIAPAQTAAADKGEPLKASGGLSEEERKRLNDLLG